MLLLGLNAALALAGWRLRTVSGSGALAAFLVGAVVALTLGWPGYALLLLYFALGAVATRAGGARKRALGIAEPGARGIRQVLANGGPPALFAILSFWIPVAAFVGALAAAAADTASSEIGKWLGGRPRRLTDLASVAPGAPGAVSLAGSLAGLLAAAAIAVAATGLLPGEVATLAAAAGFVAALLEGLLVPFLDHDAVNAASVSAGGLLALAAATLA